MSETQGEAHGKWPKQFAPLTSEQKRISDDFMQHWHKVLPGRYGLVERFNHGWPVKVARPGFRHTLEIGAGLGEHLAYEKLTSEQRATYVAVELRENMSAEIRQRFPGVQAVTGDCQQILPFSAGHFDRLLAIHVLEHLPDLPAAIRELRRLCAVNAELTVVIPCEGSIAYGLARRISAQRVFEQRYGQSYRWFIEREHINSPTEIREELAPYFDIVQSSYFPLGIPFEFCNLCIGMVLRPR